MINSSFLDIHMSDVYFLCILVIAESFAFTSAMSICLCLCDSVPTSLKTLEKIASFFGPWKPWIWPNLKKILENSLNLFLPSFCICISEFYVIIMWQKRILWEERMARRGGKGGHAFKYILENCCWPWKSLKQSWIQLSKVCGNPVLVITDFFNHLIDCLFGIHLSSCFYFGNDLSDDWDFKHQSEWWQNFSCIWLLALTLASIWFIVHLLTSIWVMFIFFAS